MKIGIMSDGIIKFDTADEKKLKDYQYDSLVYRYIRAREQMAEYEYLRDRQSNISNHTEWTVYRQRADRDIMCFVQILNEVIGENKNGFNSKSNEGA